jgi:hypothetical protein
MAISAMNFTAVNTNLLRLPLKEFLRKLLLNLRGGNHRKRDGILYAMLVDVMLECMYG